MENILIMKSSGAEPYELYTRHGDSEFQIRCTCPAGTNGMLCKHALSVVEGSTKLLQDQTQADTLTAVSQSVPPHIHAAFTELTNLEKKVKQAQATMKSYKKGIWKSLLG